MTTTQLIVTLPLVLLFVFAALGIGIYNEVQRLNNLIPEATSNIAVLQKKRTDLITKLISIVDSYGIHEAGISTKVSGDFGSTTAVSSGMVMVARLSSLKMDFPELKADRLYGTLMEELSEVETEITLRREQYNSAVRAYNTTLSQFPNNLLLLPFNFPRKPFLSDDDLNSKSQPL